MAQIARPMLGAALAVGAAAAIRPAPGGAVVDAKTAAGVAKRARPRPPLRRRTLRPLGIQGSQFRLLADRLVGDLNFVGYTGVRLPGVGGE